VSAPLHGAGAPFFYGWWLVGAGFLLQGVVTAAVSYSYGLVLAPLAAEFRASRFEMMLGITACTLASGLTSPFLGIAIDRRPLRALACIGVAMLALGFLALSLAGTMWHVTAAYAVFMSTAMILMGPTLVSPMLARWFLRRRGLAMGVAALGTSVCGFALPPLLQAGIDGLGWRSAFQLFAAGTTLLLLPLAWLLLEDSPSGRGLAPDGAGPASAARAAPAAAPGGASTAEILRQGNFWMVAITLGVLFSVYSSLLSNLAPLATGHGVTAERAAYLISTVALFGVAGKLGFGAVADRVDLRAGLAAAVLLVIASLGLLMSATGYVALLAASAALGLAAGGMLPVWGALLAVLFGAANYGRVMGLMNPVMMPVVLLGSPFAGWSYDLSGDYVLACGVFAGLLALSLFALARVRMPQGADAA